MHLEILLKSQYTQAPYWCFYKWPLYTYEEVSIPMTCSVGQAFNGFDSLIKKNQLSKLWNMPEEDSFLRPFSYFEREKETETDNLANAPQEVAASVFPLADYPGATWWHCWFQFALWSRGWVVSWSNYNKLVSGLHEELHLGLTAFIETSACLYSCHLQLKMENSIVNALLEPPLALSPNTETQPFLKGACLPC